MSSLALYLLTETAFTTQSSTKAFTVLAVAITVTPTVLFYFSYFKYLR